MTKCIVTASTLTVRAGPGATYKALGYIKENDIVEILESLPDDSWKKVQTPTNLIGWCSSSYLEPLLSSLPPDFQPAYGMVQVNSIALFIHQGPQRKYRVTGFLKRGDLVDFLASSLDGSWTKVRTSKGIAGWSVSKYLTRTNIPGLADTGMHRLLASDFELYKNPGFVSPMGKQVTTDCLVNVTEVSADGAWKNITTNLGLSGWCQARYLTSVGDAGRLLPVEEFPWIPIAFGEMGVREYPGSQHNRRVQEYLASTALGDGPILPDETPWCAAFVNWCVEKSGVPSNNSPVVTSWARWGQALEVPRRGCVVTFRWDDGGLHVAFYLGESGSKVFALGGNQAEGVWIMAYARKNVGTYRIPANWKL